jgi:hypothetical protein
MGDIKTARGCRAEYFPKRQAPRMAVWMPLFQEAGKPSVFYKKK